MYILIVSLCLFYDECLVDYYPNLISDGALKFTDPHSVMVSQIYMV